MMLTVLKNIDEIVVSLKQMSLTQARKTAALFDILTHPGKIVAGMFY